MHRLVPTLPRTGFSVEAWALVTGGAGTPRTLASCGRFELGLNRFNAWTMTVLLQFKDKPVVGEWGVASRCVARVCVGVHWCMRWCFALLALGWYSLI